MEVMIKKEKIGRLGVLMGGPSTEREVSLKSGKSVYESLKQLDLDVVAINITTDNIQENIKFIASFKIDCAFIALHGRFGEDGQIQEILDALGVPYTGSGALASKLAMDKIVSRRVLEIYGLTVPKYKVLDKNFPYLYNQLNINFNLPLVVKPATHGSSIGLSIAENNNSLKEAIDLAFSFDERIVIEEYIQGRELTVGILDDKALPIVEVIPKNRFFDYEAKYSSGMTDYLVPAELDPQIAKKVQLCALSTHRLLGCYGCSRVDIILRKDNTPFILELNSIPGLTPTSLLPKAAKVNGIGFAQLCLKLIELAYEKAEVWSPC